MLPRFQLAHPSFLWTTACLIAGERVILEHPNIPISPLADRLTRFHGRGIGGRAGGPGAGAVIGPHRHMVLGVRVEASDAGVGV